MAFQLRPVYGFRLQVDLFLNKASKVNKKNIYLQTRK
jgi:hypothetical protein